ncbi:hypothetical protein [Bradyrhizobium sp. NAS80.1]|uniref:hypothetical protein n=1 Tax=Bradyrhizobium sp. NAS80.1 TaxID=1680159 RepID=UPI00143DF6CC|nr:hypothetical protein [Bradyrhizobium sp. NAS80.1]
MDLPTISRDKNPKASVAEHRAALVKANGNLSATRECQAHQRRNLSNDEQQHG